MEPLLATLQIFATKFAPKGWMPCEGQLLSVDQYQMLYSLIGGAYGGDGVNTFALPDLRGKEPEVGLHYFIAVEGVYFFAPKEE